MATSLKAVLFDLDDTLYDHLHSAQYGLLQLRERYPSMAEVPIRDLEGRYSVALESIHPRLLCGEVTQREARTQRMQQLFRSFDINVDDQTAMEEYQQFRRDYDSVCRVVHGSHNLLTKLRNCGLRLAIVTNNLVSEQIPKLKQLGLDDYFDVVSISEAVGLPKPAPRIFEVTLNDLDLSATEVVMVGDSLQSDIRGATNMGMRSVWLKRRPDSTDSAPPGVRTIYSDFADGDQAFKQIVATR